MQILKNDDIFFILSSFLVCITIFFAVIMPKVQTNRATRRKLQETVAGTKEIAGEIQRIKRLRNALKDDPYIRTYLQRAYLELQKRPWPRPEQIEDGFYAGRTGSERS